MWLHVYAIVSVIPSRSARKPSCLEIENLSSSGHLVNTTAKQVISRRAWKDENSYEIYKSELLFFIVKYANLYKVKSLKFSYFDVR